MKTFELLKLQLRNSGILQFDSSPKARRCAIAINCVFLGVLITSLLSTGWFLLFNARTNSEYADGCILAFTSVFIISWYSICVWNKEELVAILDDLDAIIEKRSEISPTIEAIYQNTNDKIAKISKIFDIIINQASVSLYILTPIGVSIVEYFSSDNSNESFHQIYSSTFPFDWRTPAGYLACVSIQALTMLTLAKIFVFTLTTIVGLCLFATSFVSDLEENVRQFSEGMRFATNRHSTTARQNVDLKETMANFINIHAEARELTIRISNLTGDLVFFHLIFMTAMFGSSLLLMHSTIKSGDIAGLVQIFMILLVHLPVLYLFCHLGGHVTQRFEGLGDVVYQLEWYTLPLDMQRDLAIAIALAQKRIYVRGYADTRSTREVFKKILKNKFACILLLRKL